MIVRWSSISHIHCNNYDLFVGNLPVSPPLRGVHSSIDTLESRLEWCFRLVHFGPGAISPYYDLYPQASKPVISVSRGGPDMLLWDGEKVMLRND